MKVAWALVPLLVFALHTPARAMDRWTGDLYEHGERDCTPIASTDAGWESNTVCTLDRWETGTIIDYRFESAGTPRIGLPSRINFMKTSDEGGVFDVLASAYPDFRVLRTCLTHAYAATGQLDAAVEWEVKFWDLAATRVIVEETGGKYVCVREREHPTTGMLYCAVFGRPALVDRIVALLAAHV